MKKKIYIITAVATLVLTMAACGTAQTSNNPTPTTEPAIEVEASTAPTQAVEPTIVLDYGYGTWAQVGEVDVCVYYLDSSSQTVGFAIRAH